MEDFGNTEKSQTEAPYLSIGEKLLIVGTILAGVCSAVFIIWRAF